MQVEISARDFETTQAIREHVTASVEAAVGRFADRLTRVEVHLGDVNSSKGGPADKRCMIEARPRGAKPIAIEHHADDLYDAVSEAAGKLRRALTRDFERKDA